MREMNGGERCGTDLDFLELTLHLLPLRPFPLCHLTFRLTTLLKRLHLLPRLLQRLHYFLELLPELCGFSGSFLRCYSGVVELRAGGGEVGAEDGDGLLRGGEGGEEELTGGGKGGETLDCGGEGFLRTAKSSLISPLLSGQDGN